MAKGNAHVTIAPQPEIPRYSEGPSVAACSLHGFTKITRHVYKPLWINREFMECSEQYREIRSRFRNKLTSCIKCGHRYEDGEMMALACFEKHGNKTLCQSCADSLSRA
jgi:hypothetical protein